MEKVRAERMNRRRPARDEKILTDWNGLAIAAFAMAARVFGSAEYLDVGRRAASFILSSMVTKEGRLFHRYAIRGSGDGRECR